MNQTTRMFLVYPAGLTEFACGLLLVLGYQTHAFTTFENWHKGRAPRHFSECRNVSRMMRYESRFRKTR